MSRAIFNITAEAAKAVYEDGYDRNSRHYIPGWQKDEQLSTPETLVLHDSNGHAVVAFRGSKEIKDWVTSDIKIITGTGVKSDRRFVEAQSEVESVIKKYGKDNITLTGHSLGGRIGMEIGKNLDIPNYVYNPGTWLFDYYSNILPDSMKQPGAFKNTTIIDNPMDPLSNVSQLTPGATIESHFDTNQAVDLASMFGGWFVGKRVKRPIEPYQHPIVPWIEAAGAAAQLGEKIVHYHEMDQFTYKRQTVKGGDTIRNSLGRVTYHKMNPSDYRLYPPHVPIQLPEAHDTFQDEWNRAIERVEHHPVINPSSSTLSSDYPVTAIE